MKLAWHCNNKVILKRHWTNSIAPLQSAVKLSTKIEQIRSPISTLANPLIVEGTFFSSPERTRSTCWRCKRPREIRRYTRISWGPMRTVSNFSLALIYGSLGDAYGALQNDKDEQASFLKSRDLLEELTAAHPDNPEFKRYLGWAYQALGSYYADQNQVGPSSSAISGLLVRARPTCEV